VRPDDKGLCGAPCWWAYRPVVHSTVSLRLSLVGWSGISDSGRSPPHRESTVIMSADFIIHQGSAESANPIPDGS